MWRRSLLPLDRGDLNPPGSMARNGGPRPAEEVFRLLEKELGGRPAASPEELQRAADRVTARYNRTPQRELQGLSPVKVERLLRSDWESPDAALHLDEALELDDLAGARILHNARRFLAELREAGGTRATQAGNLNRKFVGKMVERLAWPPGFRENLHRYNKVVNEGDAFPLHVLRVLLETAGLLARRKGAFRVTRKAEPLLAEERAGALYAHLFRTHFRRFNLAYLDRADEAPGFQHTVAVTLYRFGRRGAPWRRPEELVADLLLAAVRERIPAGEGWDRAALILETRLLRPLELFGLAELREEPGERPYLPLTRWRKTPLFDRFLRFRV